jgi:hypothetical protein
MKIQFYLTVAALSTLILFASCHGNESEVMTQAKGIQQGLLRQRELLDSTIRFEMKVVDDSIASMAENPALASDTLLAQHYYAALERKQILDDALNQVADWFTNNQVDLTGEVKSKGIANPFSTDANDDAKLKEVQASQSKFNDLQSEIESAIQ